MKILWMSGLLFLMGCLESRVTRDLPSRPLGMSYNNEAQALFVAMEDRVMVFDREGRLLKESNDTSLNLTNSKRAPDTYEASLLQVVLATENGSLLYAKESRSLYLTRNNEHTRLVLADIEAPKAAHWIESSGWAFVLFPESKKLARFYLGRR
jgi:hypothetical protein